jgi:hypothetical protein
MTGIGLGRRFGILQLLALIAPVLGFAPGSFAWADGARAVDDYVVKQALDGVFESDAAWGDFDGDGDFDLVICGESAGGKIARTYENAGDSLLFRQDLVGVQSNGSGALAWGDYDNDGDLDLALAGSSSLGPVARIYANDGDGDLTEDAAQSLHAVNQPSLAWGDVDRDGDLDLYLQGHDGVTAVAYLYENDPIGSLTVSAAAFTGLYAGSADWGDWNGDGYLDLLVTGSDGASTHTIFYRNSGLGTLSADGAHGLPGFVLSDAAFGDYDADGDLDLAVTGNTASGGDNLARVYGNNGSGSFTLVTTPLSIYRSSCAWGDHDADGDLDLAFMGYTGTGLLTMLYENNAGVFEATDFDFPAVREGSLSFADADRDGDLEFLVTGASWSTKYAAIYERVGGEANDAPLPPTTREGHLFVPEIGPPGDLVLEWSGASDAETPANGLLYCVRVGTTPGGHEVLSGTYGSPLMGNVGERETLTIEGVGEETCYWSVRTIDAGLTPSVWSPEEVVCPEVLYHDQMQPSGDATVDMANPNTTFDSWIPTMLHAGGFAGAGDIARAYLGFYIGELPAGATVLSATLSAYLVSVSCGSPYYVDVWQEYIDNWSEQTITWANAPAMWAPSRSDRVLMTAPGLYSWDVTSDVTGTVDGDLTLVLRAGSPPEGTSCMAEYFSKDQTLGPKPVLDIWYSVVVTEVEEEGDAAPPARFALEPCAPNPFNPSMTIRYSLPERGRVSLAIYDVAGREVRVLLDRVPEAEGAHEAVWDGLGADGREARSGVYFVRLVSGVRETTGKAVLIR